jgi:O-antigen ligase
MAFPGIILWVNISLYFFVGMFLSAKQKYGRFARSFKTDVPLWAILFGIGATISVYRIPSGWESDNFNFALSSLPNYIYWSSVVCFLNKYRAIVDYDQIIKFVFYGVTFYIPFWFIRENFLSGIALFQKTTANNLAFLMISYSPMAISYVRFKKSQLFAILYFIGILMLMLFLGRRAGFVLVLINGLFTLFVRTVDIKSFFKYGLMVSVFWLSLNLTVVEQSVKNASPRIYQMIYESDEMKIEDRSYLTRIAMIEKGVYLFKEYPLSGVGLTNFHRTEGIISGNFEGSQYVINKNGINELSAHNSYISALAEGGLVLFVPWLFLMLSIIIRFVINISVIEAKYYPLFWGFFGMILHYTSVVGYVNVYSWFVIAMCGVVLSRIGEEHVNSMKPIKRVI